jgi:hypothetical protein
VFGDGLAAVVEDPLQVAADEEAVGDRAEGAEGDRVADARCSGRSNFARMAKREGVERVKLPVPFITP